MVSKFTPETEWPKVQVTAGVIVKYKVITYKTPFSPPRSNPLYFSYFSVTVSPFHVCQPNLLSMCSPENI